MVVLVALAAAAAVVVVLRGWELALGCIGAHTFSTFNAQHQGQAFGAERLYSACRLRVAWGWHACIGRV